MGIHLVGGGWDVDAVEGMYAGFLADARDRAGHDPRVLVVVMGTDEESLDYHRRYEEALDRVGGHTRTFARVAEGAFLDADLLDGHDAVLVGGGPTPEYHRALAPVYGAIRERVEQGLPYAGFSAGAEIASRRAIIGGWLLDGVPICPEDSSEDLEELTAVDGIGLVEPTVEVHTAAWGNLSRIVAAVGAGLVPAGIALDECTTWEATSGRVSGTGAVWRVTPGPDGVVVRRERP